MYGIVGLNKAFLSLYWPFWQENRGWGAWAPPEYMTFPPTHPTKLIVVSIYVTWHVSPTLLDHLPGKLGLGLVSCNLVQSQVHEYLNQLSTHPIGGTIDVFLARLTERTQRYALCNGRELSISSLGNRSSRTLSTHGLTRVKLHGYGCTG